MSRERQNSLQAIQMALKMELEGKEFYLKASETASSEPGRRLLATLASEEDLHARKFTEIYTSLSGNKDWPIVDFKPDGGRHIRTVFSEALEQVKNPGHSLDTELSAARTAMEMENKTFDFYQKRSKDAGYRLERELYDALATQEREHHLVLLDYYEFLKDPAAWFVKKEHPSLDGG